MSFDKKVEMGELRKSINGIGVGDAVIQYEKDISSGIEVLQVTSAFDSGDKVKSTLLTQFPDSNFQVIAASAVGPLVAQ